MPNEQIYYDDIEPGDEIGPVRRAPSREEIKAYLAIGGPIHPGSFRFFDDEYAHKEGLRNPILPGTLGVTFLARLLTDWAGPGGRVRRMDVNFRRMAEPDDELDCEGVVIDKEIVDGEGHVRVDVTMKNLRTGDSPTIGTAVVILPTRS